VLDAVRDENGNAVKSHLKEKELQTIAAAANGVYLQLRGANTIDSLYQRYLAPLPKAESREQWVRRARERYHWPLALGILLLIAEIFIPERRNSSRRDARKAPLPAPADAAPPVVAIVALMLLPGAMSASPASAMRDYREGRFAAAQKEFERLATQDKNGGAKFLFNAGDAAYRGTNYDDALRLFSSALQSPDLKLQAKAYFNLGNTQFRIGETNEDLDGVENQWREAIKSYEKALALDTKDPDIAHNLEFAKKGVAFIEMLRNMAAQAKTAADDAVRRRNYHDALGILEEQVQNNYFARPFTNYVQRLKNIDEIATPQQH